MMLDDSLATTLHGPVHGWGSELISSAHQRLGRRGIVGICCFGFSDGNLRSPRQYASIRNNGPRWAGQAAHALRVPAIQPFGHKKGYSKTCCSPFRGL